MKHSIFLAIVLTLNIYFSSNAQVKILFDTDFGGDADDLGALAMLHGFIDSKECELLGIMVWSTEISAVPAIEAVNRYYNHPEIPIGVRADNIHASEWNYSKAIADKLPNELTYTDVPEVTALYRKILARNADKSITLVTVGPLANIKKLLESGPDEYSKLNGKKLFHKKVKQMVVMGGQYPVGNKEWNFWGDMKGVSKYVFDNISLPVVFSGYEVGDAIRTGTIFNEIDQTSPLYIGFKHFSENAPWMRDRFQGEILDNASFDQTAVLYAVRGMTDHWERVITGKNMIDDEGNNNWIHSSEKHNQSYLRLKESPEKMAEIIESLMLFDLKQNLK